MSAHINWPNWRAEKSASIASCICQFMARSQKIPYGKPYKGHEHDLRDILFPALNNATKIFCKAICEHRKDTNRWSPELAAYLFANPDKCDEALEIVASEDYRDGYYDKVKQ